MVDTSALWQYAARAAFAALPVVSMGLLCPVPSLVLAVRRGGRAHWLAFGAFSVVLAAWITDLQLTPSAGHGLSLAIDLPLIMLSMVAPSVHAWTAWPQRVAK
ncbi:hypothetical protein VT52_032390 [Streptomyces malaysiense]|uniref:Uncharacterized protein n=1 Tax=Streptomyces malaysiense TaxID=1428626 RepID=A0A1J4PTP9_9ACTN|nr:hypothetical protein VT52_032390 [Streptomyces malaysiense]